MGNSSLAQRAEELERENAALRDALAAEEANRAKSRFLSSMSHDIRTPMNAIMSMTAIGLSHIDEKARVQDCLDRIRTASAHLMSLVNDVLDISRISSGRMTLSEERFSLADLVHDVAVIVRPQAEQKKHRLTFEIGEVPEESLIGDPLRLRQILVNIINNAVKYTGDGGLHHAAGAGAGGYVLSGYGRPCAAAGRHGFPHPAGVGGRLGADRVPGHTGRRQCLCGGCAPVPGGRDERACFQAGGPGAASGRTAPELPWERYLYMTHQQMASSMSHSKERVMTPELRWAFVCCAIDCHCGVNDFGTLLARIERLLDSADPEDRTPEGMYGIVSLPAFYCQYLRQEPERIPGKADYVDGLYRRTLAYASQDFGGGVMTFDEAVEEAAAQEGKRFSPLLTARLRERRVTERLRRATQEGRKEAYRQMYEQERASAVT
ncbi:MAG: hypothetical protein HDT18_05010 [Oscillibacter sp.]|nr:hypothetical protein [Oscillibacter sp.]